LFDFFIQSVLNIFYASCHSRKGNQFATRNKIPNQNANPQVFNFLLPPILNLRPSIKDYLLKKRSEKESQIRYFSKLNNFQIEWS